jgi:hypothetical protein
MGVMILDVNNPYKPIGGGSLDQALFKKPSPQQPEPVSSSQLPKKERRLNRKPVSPKSSAPARQILATPSTASDTTRSFLPRTVNLYEDQIDYLSRQVLQDRLSGKNSSMNAWIREAMDDWIAKHKSSK